MACNWAEHLKLEVRREPARWDLYGKGAGPIRNQAMLDEHKPRIVVAFRNEGPSPGTDDMVTRARIRLGDERVFVWFAGVGWEDGRKPTLAK